MLLQGLATAAAFLTLCLHSNESLVPAACAPDSLTGAARPASIVPVCNTAAHPPAPKHTQYSLRHLAFLQLHRLYCIPAGAGCGGGRPGSSSCSPTRARKYCPATTRAQVGKLVGCWLVVHVNCGAVLQQTTCSIPRLTCIPCPSSASGALMWPPADLPPPCSSSPHNCSRPARHRISAAESA